MGSTTNPTAQNPQADATTTGPVRRPLCFRRRSFLDHLRLASRRRAAPRQRRDREPCSARLAGDRAPYAPGALRPAGVAGASGPAPAAGRRRRRSAGLSPSRGAHRQIAISYASRSDAPGCRARPRRSTRSSLNESNQPAAASARRPLPLRRHAAAPRPFTSAVAASSVSLMGLLRVRLGAAHAAAQGAAGCAR